MRRDRRTLDRILAEPRWNGLSDRARSVGVTEQQARDIDRLLLICESARVTHVDEITEPLVRQCCQGQKSPSFLARLWRALFLLLPGAKVVKVVEHVLRDMRRRWTATRHSPKKGRTHVLKHSIAESDLPTHWIRALSDMRIGERWDYGPIPAAMMIPTISMKLRQLAHSAKARNLPVEISVETLTALHQDLRARAVTHATLRATCGAIRAFASFIGADQDILDELSRLVSLHDSFARQAPKRKHEHLHNIGTNPTVGYRKAEELLEKAADTRDPRVATALRNEALSLALYSVLSVRLSDTRLINGVSICWLGDVYEVNLTLSKGGNDYAGQVDRRLTPFIDAVLLHGLDPVYLPEIRREAEEAHRPLLVTVNGAGVGYNYVSDAWRKHLGTGQHIARSLVHEALSETFGQEGVEAALALCGQRAPSTRAHYQGQAAYRGKVKRSQDCIADIAGGLPPEVWAL